MTSKNVQRCVTRTGRASNIVLHDVLSPVFASLPRNSISWTCYTCKQDPILINHQLTEREGTMCIVNLTSMNLTHHPFTYYTNPYTLHILITRIPLISIYKRKDQQSHKPSYMHAKPHSLIFNKHWSTLSFKPTATTHLHITQTLTPYTLLSQGCPNLYSQKNDQQSHKPSYMHTKPHSLILNTHWSTLSFKSTSNTHLHITQTLTSYTFLSQGCP